MKPYIPLIFVLSTLAGSAHAQTTDPQARIDRMLRQQEIESQQRLDDRQQERLQLQQQEAYDGRMCALAGYPLNSPDYRQCIKDSAAQRSGEIGGAGPRQARPQVECTTVGPSTTCD